MSTDPRVVIVCQHVASHQRPILFAQRQLPLGTDDSGWMVSCHSSQLEDERTARPWTVSQVIAYDPSFAQLMDRPYRTCWIRRSADAAWEPDPAGNG